MINFTGAEGQRQDRRLRLSCVHPNCHNRYQQRAVAVPPAAVPTAAEASLGGDSAISAPSRPSVSASAAQGIAAGRIIRPTAQAVARSSATRPALPAAVPAVAGPRSRSSMVLSRSGSARVGAPSTSPPT